MTAQAREFKIDKCATPRCKRDRAHHRKHCLTCVSRKYRHANPMRAAYQNLKTNAKRRGKEFKLTFEEFEQFAIECDYIRGKGKRSTSYSIDRIDNDKGYTIDNIRVITLSENSKKGSMRLDAYYDEEQRRLIATVKIRIPEPPDAALPF